MFSPIEEYKKQLDHLVEMAKMDGFKSYAWERAKLLDKEPMFSGIADDLIKRMTDESSQD
jgi:hypothetical protein